MERWKSRGGKSQRREEKKKEDQRRERVRGRCRCAKGSKVAIHCVFSSDLWLRRVEIRKVGSLKRRVRSRLGRWEMKHCTPLWREAHFEVKMCKAHQVWNTFGSCNVENLHTVVARSTFRSQNAKNIRGSVHFWRFRCRFSWQAQGIVHLVECEQSVRVL